MLVSIITVIYNSAATIRHTIDSVLAQTHVSLEYILVDGGSTDGTLEIIRSYTCPRIKWVSEPDKGIYDAMNKGIGMASGEVIGILNADDLYTDCHVISHVVSVLEATKTDSVYADLAYVASQNVRKVVRYWRSGRYCVHRFRLGWMPPHPTFFVKREVYSRYGKFDLDFKSSADYEIMLRFLCKHRISVSYLPRVIVRMRMGGKSNASVGNRLFANREDRRAWMKNNLNPHLFTLAMKPLRKVGQYFMPTERTPATAQTYRYLRELGL